MIEHFNNKANALINQFNSFKSKLLIVSVIYCLFCNSFSHSQSKKEQILIKQLTIDSLIAINKNLNQKIISINNKYDSIELNSKKLASKFELINIQKQNVIDSLIILSSKNDNQIVENIIKIDYGKIEGYNITVLWYPIDFKIFDLQTNTGPAIILLENSLNEINYFTIKHFSPIQKVYSQNEDDYEALNNEQIEKFYANNFIRDSNFRIIKVKNKQIDLSYLKKNELPFYFVDINYDLKNEIILIDQGSGQRGINRNLLYDLNNEKIFPIGNDIYNNDIGIECLIDDLTKINTKNQTITIINSSGFCSTTEETHKFILDKYKLVKSKIPIEIYNNNTKENECFEQIFNYDIETGKKTLVSKLKIN